MLIEGNRQDLFTGPDDLYFRGHSEMLGYLDTLPFDPKVEKIKDDALLTERFGSMADHLGRNGVDLAKERIVLGPMLKFNPATEWAEGNGELDAPANQLATREYRAPYTVPEVL